MSKQQGTVTINEDLTAALGKPVVIIDDPGVLVAAVMEIPNYQTESIVTLGLSERGELISLLGHRLAEVMGDNEAQHTIEVIRELLGHGAETALVVVHTADQQWQQHTYLSESWAAQVLITDGERAYYRDGDSSWDVPEASGMPGSLVDGSLITILSARGFLAGDTSDDDGS